MSLRSTILTRGVALLWGVGGVLVLCLRAAIGLWPKVQQAVDGGLQDWQWVVGGVWVLAMAWAEGYRGFQRKFSPRVIKRYQHLCAHPTALRLALAPLFCMGLFGATTKRKLVSWGLLLGVTGLVLLVRLLPQPWRGIVDAGVVVGLSWGSLSLLGWLAFAWRGEPLSIDPDLPKDQATALSPGRAS